MANLSCCYLNEGWLPGWGKGFSRKASASDSSKLEMRCIKPQRWGGAPVKLDDRQAELCRSTASSRCWQCH